MEVMKIHFVLGERDADIVYWKNSLPKRTFNFYVVNILKSERKSRIAVLPIPEKRGLLEQKTELSLYIREKSLVAFLSKIKKGRRSDFIKRVIRKHLEANYSKKEQNETEKPIIEDVDEERENFLRMIGK